MEALREQLYDGWTFVVPRFEQKYCIDTFDVYDPKDISYLDEKRIYWSRCNVNDSKQLEHVMKNIWNSPRFNIIIDNTNNYETLRRYGIGKYYKEANNEIFCHSCQR